MRKIEKKNEGKKFFRKIKLMFKLKRLILYVYSNSFYLFLFYYIRIKNFKICKILRNFDYI